jgi:hypothetical protein
MVANDNEQLVFTTDLQGMGPSQGLFMVSLGPLTLVSETVTVGDSAPGTDGGTFASFGPLSINDNGLIAVQAQIDGGNISEGVFTIQAKRAKLVDGIPR